MRFLECILLLSSLLFYACESEKRVSPLPPENIILGKADSVFTTYFGAIEKFGRAEKNELQYVRNYIYGIDGRLFEENLFSSNGELLGKYLYKYDDQGRQAKCDIYNGDGTLGNTNTYEYKMDRKEIIHNAYADGDNLWMKNVSKLDQDDNIAELVSYNGQDSVIGKSMYQYDKNGNQIERIMYDDGGELMSRLSFEYADFDTKGNWSTQIVFENGRPITVISRKIIYPN